MSEAPVEKVAEVEGLRFRFLTREQDLANRYSFDGGKTWRGKLVEAYQDAKKAGVLVPEVAPPADAAVQEAAATTVELLAQVKKLRPGESLKVIHAGTCYQVLAERVVLQFRPSALEGIGLEDPPVDGAGDDLRAYLRETGG